MAYDDTILAESGLQSYWTLSELSGNALDSKGSVTGTLATSGSILPHQGQPGLLRSDGNTAYLFDISSLGYVDFGDNYRFAGTATFSVEAWINPLQFGPGGGNDTVIVEKSLSASGGGWSLRTHDTGSQVRFYRFDGSGNEEMDSAALTLGGIYYCCGTYDGTTMQLYINAVSINAGVGVPSSRSITGSTTPLRIGAASGGGNYYAGVTGRVAIYNTVLSQSTITAHFLAGIVGAYPSVNSYAHAGHFGPF